MPAKNNLENRSKLPPPPSKLPPPPAYRQRAGRSQALVTLCDAVTKQRRDYWLGEYDTPESRERYYRVIAAWEAAGRRLPAIDVNRERSDPSQTAIVEVILEYWRWAESYYRPRHVQALHGALRLLRQMYGQTPAAEFGPQKLRLMRDEMIRGAPAAAEKRRP